MSDFTLSVNSDLEEKEFVKLINKYEDSYASHDHTSSLISGIRFHILFIGLALGLFLAALDATIVVTATGVISSEFNSVDQIGWLGSIFLFTVSGFQQMYYYTAEILGQRCSYIISVFIFVFGSVLCGISNSMTMLIISRAIQGIGGAGLLTSVLAIICVLLDSKSRALYQSIIGIALGIASIVGPLLGGWLAERNQWRWCFFINIFIGAIILVIIILFCDLPPTEKQKERQRNEKTIWKQLSQVDYASFILLMPGTICFLIGLQIGSETLKFDSTMVILCLTIGPILVGLFVVAEIYVIKRDPIFPHHFVASVTNIAVLISQFMIGIAYNSMVYFIPLFFQIVKGDNPVQAALELLSLIIAGIIGSLMSGIVTRITGNYKLLLLISGVICLLGSSLLCSVQLTTPNAWLYVYLAMFGFGHGIASNLLIVAGQANVDTKDYIIATAHGQFMRLFGGAFGVNVASVLFNYHINHSFEELRDNIHQDVTLKNLQTLKSLSPLLLEKIHSICFYAFKKIYILISIAIGIFFITSIAIKQVKMNNEKK